MFGYGLGLVCLLVFPKVFRKPKKTFGKTINIKKRNEKQNSGKPTTKTVCLKVSDPPLDMGLFCLVVWFSRRFLENQTNIRENQKYQRKP